MKTLYIQCSMGAAGDMIMAALMELISHRDEFLAKMNHLGIPKVHVTAEKSVKCGIEGNRVGVTVDGREEGHHHHEKHHHHSSLADIDKIIEELPVSNKVKKDAMAIYQIIAEAESQVHGKKTQQIHFHEVGALDAVADIVGSCILMEEIGADKIVVSPIHVGSGTVSCAHGILPVPAPATALILQGVPIYGGAVEGELCTPTGAAILKYFGDDFGVMPPMKVKKIGYGMGSKDFAGEANCLRIMLGEENETADQVVELAANIDDMTAEEIGFAMEELMNQGALDVYCAHITMKKSRPAIKLVCLCRAEDEERITQLMFLHTTTIGIRQYKCDRKILPRHTEKIGTPLGEVEKKICQGYGVKREKWEFDRIAELARKTGKSIGEIKKEIDE